jgi:tetratricopeptide (TPR) repeat protein
LLHSLGTFALTTGVDHAAVDFERSSQLFEQLGDLHGRALGLDGLATVDRLRGRYESALAKYEEALAGFEDANDLIGKAHVLSEMAQIYMSRQEYSVSGKLLDDALTACGEASARRVAAQTEQRIAERHLLTGKLDQAEELFRLARRASSEDGDLTGQASALLGLGATARKRGDFGLAEKHLRAAAELADRGNYYLLRGRILLAAAELDLAMDRTEEATAKCVQAVAMLSHLGPTTACRARAVELTA